MAGYDFLILFMLFCVTAVLIVKRSTLHPMYADEGKVLIIYCTFLMIYVRNKYADLSPSGELRRSYTITDAN